VDLAKPGPPQAARCKSHAPGRLWLQLAAVFLCSAHPCASPLRGLRAKILLAVLWPAVHGGHPSGRHCV